jgi:hypothetical protein
MASGATSTGSSLSSPVRFESPPPELCPQPLRLHRSKSKFGFESMNHIDSTNLNAQIPNQSQQSVREEDSRANAVAQKRLSRLGSLVSKFEILDAANSTGSSSSRAPRPVKVPESPQKSMIDPDTSDSIQKVDGAQPSSSIDPLRRSKDFGTQTDLSYNHGIFCVLPEDDKSLHRECRISELRRRHDRSSPGSFLSFARQKSSISGPKDSTPPALATEITVNDFECTFLDGQEQNEPSTYSHTPEPPPASSPTPPAVNHESPIKDRIKHFERLQRRSDASRVSLVASQAGDPVSTMPRVVESHHPVRDIWRRISHSLTQSFDGSHEQYRSSYRESTTSVEYIRSPYRSVFPLLPARKSFPFIPKMASDAAENHIFGLDGANQSTPRVPDIETDVFRETSDGATNSKHSHGQGSSKSQRPSNDSAASHHTSHTLQGGFLKRTAQQDRDKRKEQKKKDKQRERDDRKKRIAQRRQNKLGETDRVVSDASSHVNGTDSRDTRWGQQTASGFMIREAGLSSGDLVAPKPRRPGQVKNIVNYYKEKSTSLLRIASGGHFGGSKEELDGDVGASTGKAQHSAKDKGKGKGRAD